MSATLTERPLTDRTRDVLKRAGNPFRNYFARNPDDEVCARFHVPELYAAERDLLQSLIDSSYSQFVDAVAEGRGLSQEVVRSFADGRVFSGAQAKELGLVDALGDEDSARRLAARLADLDEEKTRPITFGKPPKRFAGLIPGRALLGRLGAALSLELAWSGQPLWLYRP